MNRSEMREQAFILLFEKEFFAGQSCAEVEETFAENYAPLSDYAKKAFENTYDKKEEIDAVIENILKAGKSAGCRRSISRFCDLLFMRLCLKKVCPTAPQ